MRSLFLTYNGVSSHIGQAQVLPYLTGLAARGHEITIISFERGTDTYAVPGVKKLFAESRIDWRPQEYSTLPGALGNAIDQRHMVATAKRVAAEVKPDVVHCRSYVPGDAALAVKRATGARFIFDMRGFWVDQRAEGLRWPQKRLAYRCLYRKWKKKEEAFIDDADAVISLTKAAKQEIEHWPTYRGVPIHVIPCAVDFDCFALPNDASERTAVRNQLGVKDSEPLFVYLGSLGSVYLLDDILRCFVTARRVLGRGRLLFMGDHSVEQLLMHARSIGLSIKDDDVLCRRVVRADVPAYLGAADVGLNFIIPSYSSLGVSPTKLGEYLACGLPVICNQGVGDVEEVVSAVSGGMAIGPDVEQDLLRRSGELRQLLSLPRLAIRSASRRIFDLDLAIDAYDHAYRSVV